MHEPVSIQPEAVYDDGALFLSLGLTSTALAKARRGGELRFTRQGRRILYMGQWVLDWLQATAASRPPRKSHGSRLPAWQRELVDDFCREAAVIRRGLDERSDAAGGRNDGE